MRHYEKTCLKSFKGLRLGLTPFGLYSHKNGQMIKMSENMLCTLRECLRTGIILTK